MAINSTRFKATFTGLSAICQKVYAAVPIQAAWTAHQVHGELHRLGTTSRDMNNTMGCLASLVRSGIVMESQRGYFTRTPIRGKTEKVDDITTETEEPMATVATITPVTTKEDKTLSPIDILARLSYRAKTLGEQASALARDIDSAAIEIVMLQEEQDKKLEKLTQLQQLLKGLS